jgi:signal transduction histidine kinase/ligand-binding sensor domain-containing protein
VHRAGVTPPLRRTIHGLALAIFLTAATHPTLAAEDNPGWSVRAWKSSDGLPDDRTNSLAQTPDGFLWVASSGTLARFDGVSFKVFLPEEFGLDPAQKVRLVLCRRDGSLCLALDHGLIVALKAGQAEIVARDVANSAPEQLTEDQSGALWASYHDGTLARILPGGVTQLGAQRRQYDDTRNLVAQDGQGRMWSMRGSQLGVYRENGFEPKARLPETVTRLTGARAGGVWICCGTQFFRYDEGGALRRLAAIPVQNPRAEPSAMLEDRSGAVWIGTSANGLWRYDGTKLESVPTSHREVMDLAEDREGSLWVSTLGGGLDQVQPRAIRVEGTEIGLPSQAVLAVAEGPDGTIWAVTQDGALARRTSGGWTNVLENGHGMDSEATCLAVDRTGAVWVGTKYYRLYRWSGGQLTSWGQAEGLVSHTLRTLWCSQAGDLWIGGEGPGSVQRLRAGQLENFTLPPKTNYVRALAEDPQGNIWAGANNRVLLRVTGDQVSDETWRIAPRNVQIRSLRATPDGSLWIGYSRGGIARLKNGVFASITAREGLYDDNISLLLPDDRGWMWFVGGTAIYKVRQQELDAVAEGRAKRVQSVQYSGEQDLRNLRLVFGDVPPGALRSRDGRLWIPAATALVIASPQVQHPDVGLPPVLVTRVTVDHEPVAAYGGVMPVSAGTELTATANLKLAAGHRQLEFDFTALSFDAPENVRFRYRLENFDDQWIEAGTERTASYTRLPAGAYRFQVTACNSDGVWNETGAAVAFTLEPYFWQTWWFRAVLLVGFTSLVFALARFVSFRRLQHKLRALEQESALERERARIARDIHDDLGSRLTKIVLLSGLAARERTAPEKAGARVWEISETARQLIKSLDETVWAVNPRNDTLPHLIDYVGQFAVNFLRTAEILCHVDLPHAPPQRPMPADVRHNLFLAVKEALNNVVRHARATAAWLRVTVTEESLTIVIEDNGQGLAEGASETEGNGLRNLRQRMAQIRGRFEITSQPGAGTRVTLSIPWGGRG